MDVPRAEELMRFATEEVEKAIQEGNSPFGAILADAEGNVVARAHNTVNTETDATAHAEINIIRAVSK